VTKKITISIIVIFLIVVIGFGIWNFRFKNNSVTENNYLNKKSEDYTINIINISTEYITDDCLNEWNDYSKANLNNVENASNNIVDENTHYLVKNINGFISIYYLDDFNNEILYRKTDISTEYLSIEDLNDLDVGIVVIGAKKLNQLLEDFE